MSIAEEGIENTLKMNNNENIVIDEQSISKLKSKFVIGPFDLGIATTIGNGLRRILLTSICGFSVFACKIKNVQHEFVTLPNVNIDLQLIIMNLKKLVIKAKNLDSYLANPVQIKIKCPLQKQGPILAKNLECPSDFEIVNKDYEICQTLADGALEMELLVRYGRGFESFSSDVNLIKNCEPGFFPIQAIYSPIKNVMFVVHEHVTKSNIRLNNLEISVTTNGAITGTDALNMACKKLIDLYSHLMINKPVINPIVDGSTIAESNDTLTAPINEANDTVNQITIKSLNLGTRAYNAMLKEGINTIGDILKKTKTEIMQISSLGSKSIKKIIEILEEKGVDVSFLK